MNWFFFLLLAFKDSYGQPSISFGNVRHLEIRVKAYFFDRRFWSQKYYDEDVGDDLITFLEKIPNLETLTIRHDQVCVHFLLYLIYI